MAAPRIAGQVVPATIGVVGSGVVGGRVVKQLSLLGTRTVEFDPRRAAFDPTHVDVVVLAHAGSHTELAHELLGQGVAVVSGTGRTDDVREMCDLDDLAHLAGVPLVVGAGQSPGLTGLLARHLANQLARCDEIHVAVHGTAGPACAHEHHRSLAGHGVALQNGEWVARRSGSGRELCWFPEPVGAFDCYRADLASPFLLGRAFPQATWISARLSANRRDRLTARLPMLAPPHAEGGVGAVRVEVRGTDAAGGRVALIAGTAEMVGTSAAATATAFSLAALAGELPSGLVTSADARLDTTALLHQMERFGVRVQEFTGIPTSM